MDFNRPPNGPPGPSDCSNCCSCGCNSGIHQLRLSAKRRRIDEPDGDPIFVCNNCNNCRMHEISTSGEDEEFSDEGDLEAEEPVIAMFQEAVLVNESQQTRHEQEPQGQIIPVPLVEISVIGNTVSPPLPASLQSPRTPGPSSTNSSNNALARVDEFGWQENRSALTARAGYLLNNSRMSDVKFLVGESKVEIYGHKTLLALGSPVFEAQFFGSVGSGSSVDAIELPDMEQETFLMFLKYLYTDELEGSLDYTQLLCLLRPAKKYIVPHLVDKCSDILMTELKPENIFQILHHAQFYELKKLEGACERYIDRNCEAIVGSEEFINLGKIILTEFLKRDGLNINEETLFQAVLRWATAECQRSSIEANYENLRLALGECLKLIRFPTMKKEEFASVFETTSILSPEEACSVFVFMCKSSQNTSPPALMFPTMKRAFAPQLCIVSRFAGEPQEHSLNYRSGEIYNYRIHFKVDRHIYLKGVNIFSIRCGPQVIYHGHKRDFNGALYLYEKGLHSYSGRKQFNKQGSLEPDESAISVNGVGRRQYYPVLFDSELPLRPGKTYNVCVVVSVNSHSYPAQPLHTFVGTSERNKSSVMHSQDLPINFTFLNSSDGSVGRFTSAQIPELIFCL